MEAGLASCVTCRVSFALGEAQRLHHKSDWHRYNLKRRMAELPPITAAAFAAKVAAAAAAAADNQSEAEIRCEPCRKTFRSQAAFDNHVPSKRHREAVEKSASRQSSIVAGVEKEMRKCRVDEEGDEEADNSDDGSEWSDSDEALGLEECLFCDDVAEGLESSLEHMGGDHSFFLPEAEYCVDVEGLKLYLGRKVGEGHVCLWCDRSFASLDAVRKHMRDKGHCRLAHDDGAWVEYADYFDFSPSYPDGLGPDAPPDFGPELEERDWQLVLPSGATLGHRSLRRYFKQRPLPEDSSLLLHPSQQRRGRLLSTYKALGWTGTTGTAAQRKAKDLAFLSRLRQKRQLKQGLSGNANLQHHFRYQVP